jgi:hypothetical protein
MPPAKTVICLPKPHLSEIAIGDEVLIALAESLVTKKYTQQLTIDLDGWNKTFTNNGVLALLS